MYLVDQNNEVVTKAKYEFSSYFKKGTWENYQYAKVCQNLKYFALYWKYSQNIRLLKNKKRIKTIFLKQSIDCVILKNSFVAVLIQENNLHIYNKKKLITKTRTNNFIRQISFTKNNQIMFKSPETVNIYDFISKSQIICDKNYISNNYGYCPVNDIILIPSGDKFTYGLSVWSVPDKKIINHVHTDWLREFRIKISKSGKYFIVSEYRSKGIQIFSYGDKVSFLRRFIEVESSFQDIEWVLGDKYLLIHSFFQFQIFDIDNNQISECKLKKIKGEVILTPKYDLGIQKQIQQTHIFMAIEGNLVHYITILL